MTDELPPPLVSADCDCTDLDGFMLNVERLMASELVALHTHEVVGAALFLWCRAWKQRPAASLPDDERVLAAFARLPLARFRRLRAEVLHGFVKCSDGRLYHCVLAGEATRSFGWKSAARKRREADAERLKKWRASREETPNETQDETRFVAEGQDRTGQDIKKERKKEGESLPEERAHKPRSTRLAPEWSPSDPLKDWTKSAIRDAQAVGKVDPRAELEKFHDWWKQAPGSKGMKLDWDATWRTWIRKAIERSGIDGKAPTHGQRQGAGTSVARAAATLRRAALAFAEQPGDGEAGGRALDAAGGDPAEGNA